MRLLDELDDGFGDVDNVHGAHWETHDFCVWNLSGGLRFVNESVRYRANVLRTGELTRGDVINGRQW